MTEMELFKQFLVHEISVPLMVCVIGGLIVAMISSVCSILYCKKKNLPYIKRVTYNNQKEIDAVKIKEKRYDYIYEVRMKSKVISDEEVIDNSDIEYDVTNLSNVRKNLKKGPVTILEFMGHKKGEIQLVSIGTKQGGIHDVDYNVVAKVINQHDKCLLVYKDDYQINYIGLKCNDKFLCYWINGKKTIIRPKYRKLHRKH